MEVIENGNLIGSVNGTVVGGAELVAGKKGLALYVNGKNQYVDFGFQGDSCFGAIRLCANGWVTAFWMRPVDDSLGTIMDTGVYDYERMVIRVNRFILKASLSSADKHWDVSMGIPLQQVWIHIVVAWQPCYGVKLYVDGELADTGITSPSTTSGKNAMPRFVVGANSKYSFRFKSMLDELRVWDAVMSDEEVWTLYIVDAGLYWDIS